MRLPDPSLWAGRRVLVTGHTGFKGSWLTAWLTRLGSDVQGLSLPETDVRDAGAVRRALRRGPEVVFHLAAQAIVRRALADPLATWETNVTGTVNVLYQLPESVKAVVVVTSDKCYRDVEAGRPMREDDALGGKDPYSASKAAQELVTHAARATLLAPRGVQVATARAGNVIGGGDEGADRLIPDLVRAARAGAPLVLRNPDSVRPWQHVINPLSGYLILAENLLAGPGFDTAFNFGPAEADARPVRWLAERVAAAWPDGAPLIEYAADPAAGHEAKALRLDSAAAATRLGWAPLVPLTEGVELTVRGYTGEPPDAQLEPFTRS